MMRKTTRRMRTTTMPCSFLASDLCGSQRQQGVVVAADTPGAAGGGDGQVAPAGGLGLVLPLLVQPHLLPLHPLNQLLGPSLGIVRHQQRRQRAGAMQLRQLRGLLLLRLELRRQQRQHRQVPLQEPHRHQEEGARSERKRWQPA